ncbi:hypothetical protein [Nocardia sp. NPDC024068]|uniref:hypothetical protein n=1 Tax=Nocardia sp. NPDC024068 TaxID=3157197 RepID=UPI00340DAD98
MKLGDAFGLTDTPDFLPRYHGAEGDTRYPSPRDLRRMASVVIDIGLVLGSLLVPILALLVLQAKTTVELPRGAGSSVILMPVLVIVVNRYLLRKWVHASLGELIFGLVEIRGRDGAWPGWRDLLWGQVAARGNVPGIVCVRRCDVRNRIRESGS